MIIFDLLKTFEKMFAVIEDDYGNSIVETMSAVQATSAITVDLHHTPDRSQDGIRAVTANVLSEDPLERILAYAVEAEGLSLRLQGSSVQPDHPRPQPINRGQLVRYINAVNARMSELSDWLRDHLTPEYSDDYHIAVRNTYDRCRTAIFNFNLYCVKINNGETDIVWADPNNTLNVPDLVSLPPL